METVRHRSHVEHAPERATRRPAVEPATTGPIERAAASAASSPGPAVSMARHADGGQVSAVLRVQEWIGNRATARRLQRFTRPGAGAPVRFLERDPITVDPGRVEHFLTEHKAFTTILAGFAARGTLDDGALVADLLDRFVKRGDFAYTGASVGSIDALQGDCSTLVRQFVAVANGCFGLGMTVSPRLPGPLFIKGGGQIIHAGAKTGNVDQGTHWRFDDHVWAVWNGKPIDVLFGIVGGLKPSLKVSEDADGGFVADGTTYYPTGLAKTSETNRYTSVAEDRVPAREKTAVEPKAEKPPLTMEEKLIKAEQALNDLYEDFVEEDVRAKTVERVMREVRRRDDAWSGDFLDPKFKTGTLKQFCRGQSMMDFAFDREKWEAWIKT